MAMHRKDSVNLEPAGEIRCFEVAMAQEKEHPPSHELQTPGFAPQTAGGAPGGFGVTCLLRAPVPASLKWATVLSSTVPGPTAAQSLAGVGHCLPLPF